MLILCIVQARMDSSRFPGKVLADLAGYPILEHVVTRAQASGLPVVVATTDREVDDPIAAWAVAADVKIFRWDGKVEDVLGRYIVCAEHHKADAIVRVTADSPLIPPDVIEVVTVQLRDGAQVAALTSAFRQIPDGWEAEGCIVKWLRRLDAHAGLSRYDREHVFPAIYTQALAAGATIPHMPPCKWSEPWFLEQRFSVDSEADLEWLRALASRINFTPPRPRPDELYQLLMQHPELQRSLMASST